MSRPIYDLMLSEAPLYNSSVLLSPNPTTARRHAIEFYEYHSMCTSDISRPNNNFVIIGSNEFRFEAASNLLGLGTGKIYLTDHDEVYVKELLWKRFKEGFAPGFEWRD